MRERRILFIEGPRALRVLEFFSVWNSSEKKTPIGSLLSVPLFFFCMGLLLYGPGPRPKRAGCYNSVAEFFDTQEARNHFGQVMHSNYEEPLESMLSQLKEITLTTEQDKVAWKWSKEKMFFN